MRETLDGYDSGIQIPGSRITNLLYAYDIVLLAAQQPRATGDGESLESNRQQTENGTIYIHQDKRQPAGAWKRGSRRLLEQKQADDDFILWTSAVEEWRLSEEGYYS